MAETPTITDFRYNPIRTEDLKDEHLNALNDVVKSTHETFSSMTAYVQSLHDRIAALEGKK